MKRRRPGSIEEAITTVYSLIGVDAAAAAVGKSTSHIYRWVNPDDDCTPSLKQALQLDAACLRATGQAPITECWNHWMSAIAKEAVAAPARRIEDAALQLASATGEVAGQALDALADGTITPAEEHCLLEKTATARRNIESLEQAVKTAVLYSSVRKTPN